MRCFVTDSRERMPIGWEYVGTRGLFDWYPTEFYNAHSHTINKATVTIPTLPIPPSQKRSTRTLQPSPLQPQTTF